MSHQIWHAFYYDRSGQSGPPCRSEVIQADDEEAAARVARAHLGECLRVTLEAATWMQPTSRVIFAEDGERRRTYLH
ncbi:MAG: hypothetical protein KGM15_14175 [Pseudomonadota bacterium]|nr:hypothetical protein [Pseudomonadota bacterium]